MNNRGQSSLTSAAPVLRSLIFPSRLVLSIMICGSLGMPMAFAQTAPATTPPVAAQLVPKRRVIVPPSQAAKYHFEKDKNQPAKAPAKQDALRYLVERIFRLPPTASPEVLQEFYHDLWEHIGDHYYNTKRLVNWERWRTPAKPIQTLDDFDTAVEAMFGSLDDRWTNYYGKEALAKQKAKRAAGIHSLGFSLKSHERGGYRVASIAFDGPAYRTRIRPGDDIVSIGATILRGLSKQEAEALLEGKIDSTISIRIRHRLEDDSGLIMDDEVEESVDLTVKATPDAKIEAKILPGGIAYVRLPDFMSPTTDDELEVAFFLLMKQMSIDQIVGLILDLRGDPGGRFEMALSVASRFLEGSEEAGPGNIGVICTATTRDNRTVSDHRHRVIERLPHLKDAGDAEARLLLHMLQSKPLVVLIDGSSASSAEIVAGALRDNKRADATIGEPTYGKSVGFEVAETPWGGRFFLTTLEYLTPEGHDLAREGGVKPTILKRQPRGAKIDEQLAEAVTFLSRLKWEPIYNPPPPEGKYDGLLLYRKQLVSVAAALILALFLVRRRQRPPQEGESDPIS